LSSYDEINTDAETYVLYQTLYTHIKWGLTSHNKYYIEAYNPVTREGMIMYEGSGDAGHEIPHSAGVELDFVMGKDLLNTTDWIGTYNNKIGYLKLNTDINFTDNGTNYGTSTDIFVYASRNTIDSLNISYYKCKSETFVIGTYIGTGASGNKIETRDVYGNPVKLRDVVIKRIDDVGNWHFYDTNRGNGLHLMLDLSDAENGESFTFYNGYFDPSVYSKNEANGQYLYFGYVDTNATTTPDDSYFNLPTDDSNLNITSGVFSFTEGIDELGFIKNTQQVTETIDFTGVQDGLYWVGRKQDGTYRFEKNKPSLGLYEKQFADDNRLVFDSESGKLFETTGGELVTNGTFDVDTTGWTAYNAEISVEDGQLKVDDSADAGGDSKAYQDINVEIGKEYILTGTLTSSTTLGYIRCLSTNETSVYAVAAVGTGNITGSASFIAQDSIVRVTVDVAGTGIAYADNISVFKISPDLGSELPPISFLENPIMVASETPMDIRKGNKLLKNTMESLEVHKELEVKGKATVNDLEIVDSFNLGQKWVDVSNNRAVGIIYLNDTNKPIEVMVSFRHDTSTAIIFYVDNISINYIYNNSDARSDGAMSVTVPQGSTYSFTNAVGDVSFTTWVELR
jgi:hypothetical protein